MMENWRSIVNDGAHACNVKKAGCKESQFYSLPLGQAVASMF